MHIEEPSLFSPMWRVRTTGRVLCSSEEEARVQADEWRHAQHQPDIVEHREDGWRIG